MKSRRYICRTIWQKSSSPLFDQSAPMPCLFTLPAFFSTSQQQYSWNCRGFTNFFLCLHVIIRAMFLKWKIISHTQDLLICCCYSVVFHLAYVYTMGENSGGHVNKQKIFPGRVLLYGSSLHAGELLMILLFSAKERGWENPPCEKKWHLSANDLFIAFWTCHFTCHYFP